MRRTERSQLGLVLGDADGNRAYQFQHTAESMNDDVRLGRTPLVCTRAQPIADYLLEPADGSLGSSTDGVAGSFLPSRSSMLSDELQMAIPLCGNSLGRFARHGRRTRRHDDGRSGMRSATALEAPCWSQAPSPVNDATDPVTWSSKALTSAPSSTSFVVSVAATIWPVSASMPMCIFRHDRRVFVPCFSTSHSLAPPSLRPVLSTSRCIGSTLLRDRGRGTFSVSARRHRVEWSCTAKASPRSWITEPISPSVCRSAR